MHCLMLDAAAWLLAEQSLLSKHRPARQQQYHKQ
jgi:hypothetical protein